MTDSEAPVPVRFATESIQGRRDYQEDAALATTLSGGRKLLAVADGMGGHAAGEVASALTLKRLSQELEEGTPLAEAVRQANREVRAQALEPGKKGMGTTLVALVVDGPSFVVANVGDSRAYLWKGGRLSQVSQDHSFVAEAMARGQSEEEAMASRWRDALTRSIGASEEVEVDLFGPFPVEDGSAVLLCSDGMYKTLSSGDVERILRGSSGGESAVRALSSEALTRGSDDNITVALAEFGQVRWSQPVGTMPLEWPEGGPPQESEAGGRGEGAEASPAGGDPAGDAADGFIRWIALFLAVAMLVMLALAVTGG
ncbi:MAG: protein phosphatase 2C domain-containing protein [Gemmatimonadota bacterium]